MKEKYLRDWNFMATFLVKKLLFFSIWKSTFLLMTDLVFFMMFQFKSLPRGFLQLLLFAQDVY